MKTLLTAFVGLGVKRLSVQNVCAVTCYGVALRSVLPLLLKALQGCWLNQSRRASRKCNYTLCVPHPNRQGAIHLL